MSEQIGDHVRWVCQPRVVVKTFVREGQSGLGQTIHIDPPPRERFVPRCCVDITNDGWL